jgi:molecular chaperone GrpE (heat shock protein)
MTCYFRHLQDIFQKAGIEVTPENKRELDKVIHSLVDVKYKNCSSTWKAVKKTIAENESDFISQLKEAWNK